MRLTLRFRRKKHCYSRRKLCSVAKGVAVSYTLATSAAIHWRVIFIGLYLKNTPHINRYLDNQQTGLKYLLGCSYNFMHKKAQNYSFLYT